MGEANISLQPAKIIAFPGPEYMDNKRKWQGIPGIERSAGNRFWAVWYSGSDGEGAGNYVVLVTSSNGINNWSSPVLIIEHDNPECRCYDPCLWVDPCGSMWLFWAQSRAWNDGRAGVWTIKCDNPDDAEPIWDTPRRLCHGVMMNKPTVLSTGEWCLPAAIWGSVEPKDEETAHERFSNIFVSVDRGETWIRRGGADVPKRAFDEHMIVERKDGTLWMLVRRHDGIGEAISVDKGATWTATIDPVIAGPNSRFFVRRLLSGRLILVNNDRTDIRSHMTAWLSDDDGHSWTGGLLLDERTGVSYPDGTQSPDGMIYIIYDYRRGDKYAIGNDREILCAAITEEDIMAGKIVNPNSQLIVRVNQATG